MYKACKFCCKGQGEYLYLLIFSFLTIAYFSRNFKIMATKPIKLLLTDDLNLANANALLWLWNTLINKTLLYVLKGAEVVPCCSNDKISHLCLFLMCVCVTTQAKWATTVFLKKKHHGIRASSLFLQRSQVRQHLVRCKYFALNHVQFILLCQYSRLFISWCWFVFT